MKIKLTQPNFVELGLRLSLAIVKGGQNSLHLVFLVVNG